MVMDIPKICVVTGTRAEYGLLRRVIAGISKSSLLDLQLIATGMHLSPEFGLTVKDIEADGYQINRRVEMLLSSDTPVGISKSMGLAVISFADAFAELRPDLLLVLGDRFEIFSAASAALIARVPIAHLHGGELTEGAFDDAIRHSITKMSHLHFVAAEEYRQRVIQMGENPDNVHLVGGLGAEVIHSFKPLSCHELEASLDFKLGLRNLLVTFHPVTLENDTSAEQMAELLSALDDLVDTNIVFTMPNADSYGRKLIEMITSYCAARSNCKAFSSLGQLRYFSCIFHFDGVIGNSSSGLLEVPNFRKGSVNIGDRQAGRLKAESVIDCEPTKISIGKAIAKLYDPTFLKSISAINSPYQSLNASSKIIECLESMSFKVSPKKKFFAYPPS